MYLVRTYGFTKIAFADKLKEIAKELFPEEFEKSEKPRTLLQALGMKMREIDEDVWAKYLFRKVEAEPNRRYVIDDLRFLNEARLARKHKFIIIKIVGLQRVQLTPEQKNHPSEVQVDLIEPDFTIDNGGSLEELYRKLDLYAHLRFSVV